MRKTIIALLALFLSIPLAAQTADSVLFAAYLREDMTVWKAYVDQHTDLLYEYGYCGYIVAEAKKDGKQSLLPEAKRYVARFKQHVEAKKNSLPKGHYEMYMSAVYVFELRLKESIHPVKAMSLAKDATKLAPTDPMVLTYYGTSLFYAPKPFGSKQEALEWFEQAEQYFRTPKWQYCWLRKANEMYIQQCKEKLKNN